ncbi:MAG: hypothetical protein EXR92_02030 [Gemmatimonadetes bacterium]|nr:hypothetical protein [Gemmatimonadota bacterium]
MPTDRPQDLSSHRRWLPAYHFMVIPVLLFNIGFAIWYFIRVPTAWNMWTIVVAVALLALGFLARVMALTVQDRLIRLEMSLRLKEVLPGPLAARAADLTPKQLVGLRFASDPELPGLIERCFSGELQNDEAVKKQIKNWRPDWLRA